MIIIRPIKQADILQLEDFSFDSVLGMTNLPRNSALLLEKIIFSEKSFAKKVEKPGDEEYLFVLEDLTTQRVGGIAAIFANSLRCIRYFYHIQKLMFAATNGFVPRETKILKLESNRTNSSEICALYLKPTFRHSGLGRLLSFSRFLFMASEKKRIRSKIIAEMRGYIDDRQISPFWEGIGRHFCHLSFVELMTQIEKDHMFIPEALPPYPIYISLLPLETQESIGRVHDASKPAYVMLQQENFTYNELIDIFEGGPILTSNTASIRSVRESSVIKVSITHETLLEEPEFILCNNRSDFRAAFGNLRKISSKEGVINADVAAALHINQGDRVRYVSAHR